MRFLPVSKLDQILRTALSHFWGKTGSIDTFGAKRKTRALSSSHCCGSIYIQPKRQLSVFPIFCADVVQTGRWRGFFTQGRRFIGTTVEIPRWGSMGAEVRPRQGFTENLFLAWKAWQANNRETFYLELRELSCPKFHLGTLWRPAIFVSLADNKGQILMRSLALLGAEAILRQAKTSVVAEQLHGSSELNSQRHPLSYKTLYRVTVESVKLMLRALYLMALFLPCLLIGTFVEKTEGRIRTLWMHMLLSCLERAGPAFIKWGQWASTRPDIFPADICNELSKLHMQAPRHSYAETRKIMKEAFRVPIEEIFDEFAEEPVASGSIAQVHRAVLRSPPGNGPPLVVAVKVRHPRVSSIIQRDFEIIKFLARLSTHVPGLQLLQLDKSVQHFASFMTRQVDLTLEAAHLQRFIYNFRKWKNVSFPSPIYPLVHPAVLVETFEEGQTVANFVNKGVLSKVHSRLAHIGSSCLLKMLLTDNFIHGDLHPGNIFVRFNHNLPEVVLLDAGMTAELNSHSRFVMLELFKAVASKNGQEVAAWTLQFAQDQSCPDPESFKRDVDAKFKQYLSERGTARSTGECMTDLFDQVRKHRVNMDGNVCTVMVTTLILEGWQRKLDPELDIIQMLGDMLLREEWAVSYDYTMRAVAAP